MHDPENPEDAVGASIQADCLDRALTAAFELDIPQPAPHETVHDALEPITGISTRLRLRPAHQTEALPATASAAPESDRIGRYEVLGEIARGGLGVVLKGRDADLGRDVALKVLLDRHVGDASMTRRLLEEAQIGGQLQHPGIVPVYEMGVRDGLRPYFSMKLVQGRTLANLLAERGEQPQDRMRLLAIFEQVCHAVGYAHSRGVVHRDLKPSNVMVGSFGEVQVVDWGLAKVLEDSHEAASTTGPAPHSGIRVSAEATSSVAGTPAYMAPEQARGESWRIDERTDVFGLGAILCEILTGDPPYVAAPPERLRSLASAAELDPALERLAASGADADLLALARQCLEVEPEARPGNASELAQRIAAYRASVETRARAAEQAVEIERHRRQRLVLGGLAGLLVLAVAGAAWGWIASDRLAHADRTRQAVDAAIERANLRWGEARGAAEDASSRWAAALATAEEAESLAHAGDADATTHARVEQLASGLRADAEAARSDAARRALELGTVERLEEIRSARGDSLETDFLQHDAAYRTAFRTLGVLVPEDDSAAAAAAIRATRVAGDLVAALDDWVRMLRGVKREGVPEYWRKLAQTASLADADKARKRMRDAWLEGKADELHALAEAPEIASWSTSSMSFLGFCLGDLGDPNMAERLLRAAQRAHPDDYWINHDLAISLGAAGAGSRAEHLRFMTVALALSPRSYHAWSDYGSALAANRDMPSAIASYRRALEIRPDSTVSRNRLGDLLHQATELQVTLGALLSVVELDPTNALAHDNLGNSRRLAGDLDGAVLAYREALRLTPQDSEIWIDLCSVLTRKGDLEEAARCCRQALRLDPRSAKAHAGLAIVLNRQGMHAQAAEQARAAIREQPDSAIAYAVLGSARLSLMDLKGAEAAATESVNLERGPKYLSGLAAVLRRQGRMDEAISILEEARNLDPDCVLALCELGSARLQQGQFQEAHDLLKRANALAPGDAMVRVELGRACKGLNDLRGAERLYREGMQLRPDYAEAPHLLGILCFDENRLEEAVSLMECASELNPASAEVRANLALTLHYLGRGEEAILAAREALRLDPGRRLAWSVIGMAELGLEHYSEAMEGFRRAHELGDALAEAPLHVCERLAELEKRLPAILRGEDQPADPGERLDLGRVCIARGDVQNALAFFEPVLAGGGSLGTDILNHPYHVAAHAAARAGFGNTHDAVLPAGAQAAHWRMRAIEWLHSDLKESTALGPIDIQIDGVLMRDQLSSGLTCPDLAGMRDANRGAQLTTEEREALDALWGAYDNVLGAKGR